MQSVSASSTTSFLVIILIVVHIIVVVKVVGGLRRWDIHDASHMRGGKAKYHHEHHRVQPLTDGAVLVGFVITQQDAQKRARCFKFCSRWIASLLCVSSPAPSALISQLEQSSSSSRFNCSRVWLEHGIAARDTTSCRAEFALTNPCQVQSFQALYCILVRPPCENPQQDIGIAVRLVGQQTLRCSDRAGEEPFERMLTDRLVWHLERQRFQIRFLSASSPKMMPPAQCCRGVKVSMSLPNMERRSSASSTEKVREGYGQLLE